MSTKNDLKTSKILERISVVKSDIEKIRQTIESASRKEDDNHKPIAKIIQNDIGKPYDPDF